MGGFDPNPSTLSASEANGLPVDRGKTVTKPFALSGLGLLLSESRFPKLLKILKVEMNLERLWRRSPCV